MNATPSISTWQSTIIEDWTQARAEILRIHPVEASKVAGIVEPDAEAHYVLKAVASLGEDGDEVLHGFVGLRDHMRAWTLRTCPVPFTSFSENETATEKRKRMTSTI